MTPLFRAIRTWGWFASLLLLVLTGCSGSEDDSTELVEESEQLLTTVYEVESALVSGPKVLSAFAGYTGTGYADYQAVSGEFVEWTVQAATAGQYQLTIRYANGAAASRPLSMQVNGSVVNGALAFPPTGAWDKWATVSLTATLKAGANKLRATSTGSSGANLDNVAVSDVAPPPFDVTLEAEAATLSGPIISKAHAGFTGSGYTDYQAATGEFIEWTVNAPAAGNYTLGFRYANGAAASRPLSLQVDGSVVNGSLAFPPTGAWDKWATISLTATLKSGANKVRTTSTGSSGADLDHLRVTSSGGNNGTKLLIDSGTFTPIQPEQGISFSRGYSFAQPFSLSAATRIDSTELYLANSGTVGRSVRAAVYRDSDVMRGSPKGSPVFSKKVTLPNGFTTGWLPLTGLNWDMPAGDYWIAFETDEANTNVALSLPRGYWSNLPPKTAFWSDDNQNWSKYTPPGAIDSFGVRLRVSTTPPPTVSLIDSGTFTPIQPEQGISFSRGYSFAQPFSLTAPTRIDSTELYLANSGTVGRSVRAAVYRDSDVMRGSPKGSPVFSKKVTLPNGFTTGWLPLTGLNWDIAAGDYWIAFETDEANTNVALSLPRGYWSNLPPKTAFWSDDNQNWSKYTPPGAIDSFGVRLRVSTTPPPTVSLIDSGYFTPIQPEQGISFSRGYSFAQPFSLTAPTRIDSTELYLANSGTVGRSVRAAVYRDSDVMRGSPKGSPVFSKKVTLPNGFTTGWLPLTGLNWDMPAGDYWIAFETDEANTNVALSLPRGYWSNLPPKTAFWSDDNQNWSKYTPPGAIDSFGVKLRVSATPPPTVSLIDSGYFTPIQPEQGISFSRGYSFAQPFSLTAPTRIDSTELYLANSGTVGRTVRAAVYRDSDVMRGSPKGSPVFSKKVTLPNGFTTGWLPLTGLNWDIAAGDYWIAFETDEANTNVALSLPRGYWSNLPPKTAFWSDDNQNWSKYTPPGAIDSFGVRLRVSTTPPPTVSLIDSGYFTPIQPEQGISFSRGYSFAQPFSLTAPTRIDSTELYLANSGTVGRTVRAAVYRDSDVMRGSPKGSPVFSKKVTLPNGFTTGWLPLTGLNWDIAAGDYWIAFETDEANTNVALSLPRGYWSNLPPKTAFWSDDNQNWSKYTPPGAIDSFGVRLKVASKPL